MRLGCRLELIDRIHRNGGNGTTDTNEIREIDTYCFESGIVRKVGFVFNVNWPTRSELASSG